MGAILTGRPTAKLPAGIFHRVTKVRRSGKQLVVTLKEAHLQEAFPQLDISSKLKFTPEKIAIGKAGTSAFDPLTASLGTSNFRCTASLGDSYVRTSQSLNLDAGVEIHFPTTWGIPTGLPYGSLSMTLSGSAALDIMLRKNTGCTAQIAAPPISGAIPVGPVVVPTYVQFGLFATASIGSDIRQHADAGFSLTAGMSFKGTSVTNISNASAHADAYVSGSGKFAVGPSIRFAVGAAGVADVHFDAKPALAFSAFLDLSCSIDIEGGSQVGINFGPFGINQPLPAPKVNLYRCPPGGSPPPARRRPTPTPPPPQPQTRPSLAIEHTGPLGAFLNQTFGYAIRVKNTGDGIAKDVVVENTLPDAGSFVGSDPSGTPSSPDPGDRYTIAGRRSRRGRGEDRHAELEGARRRVAADQPRRREGLQRRSQRPGERQRPDRHDRQLQPVRRRRRGHGPAQPRPRRDQDRRHPGRRDRRARRARLGDPLRRRRRRRTRSRSPAIRSPPTSNPTSPAISAGATTTRSATPPT